MFPTSTCTWLFTDLHPEATMVMMMDVEVLELCTSTVAKMPIIRPQTGFCINSLLENAWPKNQTKPVYTSNSILSFNNKNDEFALREAFDNDLS